MDPPSPSKILGHTLEGKWTIVSRLGSGGMGTVFLAHDAALDRDVAVKFLSAQHVSDEAAMARFQREAQVMARLDHPNLVPIHAFGNYLGLPYMVMKHVTGKSLAEWIRARGAPDLQSIERMLTQLCAGLGHLHEHGIIHRDIKPSNIMLGDSDHVTLLDFGVARPQSGKGVTPSGAAVGTPRYMAPEQVMGIDIDQRVDVYALGVLLFELTTGTALFTGQSDLEVLKQHVETPVPDPLLRNPAVPPGVADVIFKALAKRPSDRFSSAPVLAAAFSRAVADPSVRPKLTPSGSGIPVVNPAGGPTRHTLAIEDESSAPTHFQPVELPPTSYARTPSVIPPPTRSRWGIGIAFILVCAAVGTWLGVFVFADASGGRAQTQRDAGVTTAALATPVASAAPHDAGIVEARAMPVPDAGEVRAVPPPPLPAPVRRGTMLVTATLHGVSQWAYVDVDGARQRDQTPLTLELSPGRHTLTLSAKGLSVKREIKVQPGKQAPLTIELAP